MDGACGRRRGGEPMQREGIQQITRRLSNKTGIEVSCLDFRRFFATSGLLAGMNPLHAQALLGQISISMTMRYI
jgi:site-specific recombinase XerD